VTAVERKLARLMIIVEGDKLQVPKTSGSPCGFKRYPTTAGLTQEWVEKAKMRLGELYDWQ
jgi:hypothetical protein